MIESVTKHPPGRFQRHRACGAEPRHVVAAGRPSSEPVQFLPVGKRHRLECPCGARTALHTSLGNAEAEWGTDYAQLALPLRQARRRQVA